MYIHITIANVHAVPIQSGHFIRVCDKNTLVKLTCNNNSECLFIVESNIAFNML